MEVPLHGFSLANGHGCWHHPAMHPPPANPLYPRWLTVAATRDSKVALRDLAGGQEWTFAELRELAAQAPTSPALLHTSARGLQLILDVLRSWRDGTVLVPDDGSGLKPPPRAALPAGCCHLKVTSGTSGRPRHVMFRADQLAADAAQIVATMGLRASWPNLGVLSMAHSYGFSNLVLPLLLHGIPLWMLDSPLPESVRRATRTGGPFTLPAVPAMWQAWERVALDFSQIRLAISAGAPLPVALESAVFARSGVKIHNFYGSSECGGIAYDRSHEPRRHATLAGTPMAGVSLTRDPATGCLHITSAAVADGYWQDDLASGMAAGPGGGCWLSQDVVALDPCGAVHVLGRAGDFISVAGHKIAPAVIEDALLRLPAVLGCVIFGVPSPNVVRVEDVVACVKVAPGTDVQSLKSALADLPSTYMPRHWWLCDDLQTDARGKTPRGHWRDRWLTQHANS